MAATLFNKLLKTILVVLFLVQFVVSWVYLVMRYLYQYIKNRSAGRIEHRAKINPINYTHQEVFLEPIQMATLPNFKIEEHYFKTGDGYTLTVWRLCKSGMPATQHNPVLLQHGLLDSSITWFLHEDKNDCLPYQLVQKGYDVWIGNNRGTKFSKREERLKDYWQYCIDHMAEYDVPAMINGILGYTQKQKIIYIGHSQGCTQFLACLSENPVLHQKIQAFVGLGPVTNLMHVNDHLIINLLDKFKLMEFLKALGFHKIMHRPQWLSHCFGILVSNLKLYSFVCHEVVKSLCGEPDITKFDLDRFGIFMAHMPGGGSASTVLQWVQIARAKEFRKFDYGEQQNLKRYGQQKPPAYDLSVLKNLKMRSVLFKGTKDAMSSQADFEAFLQNVNKDHTEHYILEDYAHLDYLWGRTAPKELYPRILNLLPN